MLTLPTCVRLRLVGSCGVCLVLQITAVVDKRRHLLDINCSAPFHTLGANVSVHRCVISIITETGRSGRERRTGVTPSPNDFGLGVALILA